MPILHQCLIRPWRAGNNWNKATGRWRRDGRTEMTQAEETTWIKAQRELALRMVWLEKKWVENVRFLSDAPTEPGTRWQWHIFGKLMIKWRSRKRGWGWGEGEERERQTEGEGQRGMTFLSFWPLIDNSIVT